MHQIEIIVNIWLQSLGDWLRFPMALFSFLGTQNAYMILMSVMYWCIDDRLGIRLGIYLLVSNGLNTILKWLFRLPRPYWIDARVRALSYESSFGLPSGHAMISSTVWGKVILWFKQRWLTILLTVVLFCIGVSRLYLGVHFLSDVLAGWVVGIFLLFVLTRLEKPIMTWLGKLSLPAKIILFFYSSILIIIFFVTFYTVFLNWAIPQNWLLISTVTAPGSTINPFKIKDIFIVSGTWFGMLAGYFSLKMMGGFIIKGNLSQKFLRFVVGVIGLLLLAFGLTPLIPVDNGWLSYSLIYLQYVLIGFWVTGLAPFLFTKLHLASTKNVY